jgi:very-short-patch-repair endonuclease
VKETIEELLRSNGGVVRRRDHPDLVHRFDRLLAKGQLVSVLPGILTTPTAIETWAVRLRAAALWAGPDAVLIRNAAARLTFWPGSSIEEIEFAKPKGRPRKRPEYPIMHCRVPPEMVWLRSGLAVSNAAYTAVDLAAGSSGGDIIDRALRSKQATITQMRSALEAMPGRRGNCTRARLLRDSRDSPWSELERRGHLLLRQGRIAGWRTNVWVTAQRGGYFVDVLFGGCKVIVEFDGWTFHHDRQAFEDDRRRRNELVLAGYVVLNFSWQQVVDDPDWVIDCVRRALRTQPSTARTGPNGG